MAEHTGQSGDAPAIVREPSTAYTTSVDVGALHESIAALERALAALKRLAAQMAPAVPAARTLRPIGLCAGELSVRDDFDAPLPEQIIQEFEGR